MPLTPSRATEQLHLLVPATLTAARAATKRILAICPCQDPQQRALYAVAVMEWLVNVVKHGYRFAENERIRISATVYGDGMELQIEDTGCGISTERFEAAPAEVHFDPEDIASLPESGMGLAIIKTVMDSVAYSSSDGVNRLVAVRRWQ